MLSFTCKEGDNIHLIHTANPDVPSSDETVSYLYITRYVHSWPRSYSC